MKNLCKYNGEFYNIDSEEKAYLLGYLFGDGWITTSTHKSNKNSITYYKTGVLSKDKEIIDKFKEIFPFFNYTLHKSKYHSLTVYNKELYDDLKNLGILERKSSENKHLLKIPNIDNTLISHFIRGLYDSDGGIYLYNTLIETFFCSTSYTLITEVQNWLLQNNIKSSLRPVYRESYLPIFYLRTKSNKAARLFYSLIYKDPNIYMNRKKDVFLKGDISESAFKKSKYANNLKSTDNQLQRLYKDYAKVIEKYKMIEQIEYPSVCCNYHTVQSGKSYKKNIIRPLFLCLKCGKKSVFNRVLLKQDELTGTPLEPHTLPTAVMTVV